MNMGQPIRWEGRCSAGRSLCSTSTRAIRAPHPRVMAADTYVVIMRAFLRLVAVVLAIAVVGAGCAAEESNGSPTGVEPEPAPTTAVSTSRSEGEPAEADDLALTIVDLPNRDSFLVGEVVDVAVSTDGITVVAYAEGPGLTDEALLVWTSPDGQDWALLTPDGLPRPGGSRFLLLESGASGYIGVVAGEFQSGEPIIVWTSPDAVSWTRRRLPLELGEHQQYFVQSLVASDSGMAVVGSVITRRPDADAVIAAQGLSLSLGDGWTVVDVESGVVQGTGPLSDIYPVDVSANGATVYDPETDETLVEIPWDVYQEARVSTGVVTAEIEYEGWLLIEDESDNSYSVVELASGERVVERANQNYLALGPDPEVTLPDGRTIATTWDELDAAWSDGIAVAAASDVREGNVSTVFHSTTGASWENVDFGVLSDDVDEVDVYWVSGAPGGTGFVAAGANQIFDHQAGASNPTWTTWTSEDGVSWLPVEVDNHPGLYHEVLAAGDSGVLVAGHDGSQRYIVSTTDGLTWVVDYEVDEAYQSEWMFDIALGSWIAAAVGSSQSPLGDVSELFTNEDGQGWRRADVPIDPLMLRLTEVAVGPDSLVLGGSRQTDRGEWAPVVIVGQ